MDRCRELGALVNLHAENAELIESRAETKVLHGKPDEKFTERVNQALLVVICGALCLEWLLRRLMKLA